MKVRVTQFRTCRVTCVVEIPDDTSAEEINETAFDAACEQDQWSISKTWDSEKADIEIEEGEPK